MANPTRRTWRARDEGLTNVATIERDFVADGCGCSDQSAAYVMLFNILHLENPVALSSAFFIDTFSRTEQCHGTS
jgi:hypothetical protein